MTEGEYRVGITFNPGGSEAVNEVKRCTAEMINYIAEQGNDPRCTALAQTAFEEAAMWAVKSITKPSRDKVGNPTPDGIAY